MRDAQSFAPCPRCTSNTVSIVHTTSAVVYLSCRACDHFWHALVEPAGPVGQHTSAAFRMTRIVDQQQSA